MDLIDIVRRQPAPEPWSEGEKIPLEFYTSLMGEPDETQKHLFVIPARK